MLLQCTTDNESVLSKPELSFYYKGFVDNALTFNI